MVYLGNEQESKAYRLFDPTTQRICVSRDVKFKENETWGWKQYMSEHIKDKPEWTDFKIRNLEVTNKHHDQGIQPIEEDNEFPSNDDDDYASPTRDSPTHSQAPHTPSTRSSQLDNTLKSLDFKKCALEKAIYTKTSKDSTLLIRVYIDDLIIIGTPKKEIYKFKAQIEEKFEMSDLGLLAYYLGIEVTQTDGDISIKQFAYANKILKETGMLDCNKTLIPMDPGTRLTKLRMKAGFLNSRGGGGKKKQSNNNDPGNAVKKVASPSTVDKTVRKERQSPLMETTGLDLYPPLPTQCTNSAGTILGKSSYANVIGKPSGTKVNFHALFTPAGNRMAYLVVVNYVRNTWDKYGLVQSLFSLSTGLFSFQFISMDGLNAMLENGSWFIRTNPFILKKVAFGCEPSERGCWSSYARAMIELRANVELKDNIVVAMPKINREGYYTCSIHVEYKWKPPRCACCKVFGHDLEKMGFKPTKQEVYQPVSKKPTISYSGKKKNTVEPNNESSPSTTPIIEKIDRMENLIIDGKAILVDNEGKPFRKVDDDSENKDSHEIDDYEYDPYDDDMYKGQKIPEMLQALFDNLDIKVKGRKKK
uniref:Ribonuclease H-like domain, reverse transcriptase, RNA-dependent DNA polymerase n=1 Tax=Tanacetum cinerariifolium TaxID=118510 RepID=A0A6L2J4I0_TANCI|nr:ribonuclease H-like domain, reverse transcriptase, RNA-dependent DNA polymerase [Tanacetum cinerariifolium]